MDNFMSKWRRPTTTRKQEDCTELVPLERKKVTVTVCSCSDFSNVEGLIQHIRQHMGDVVETVRFKQFPYNISDMNKFDLSGIDVLLLCHSINNRRFAVTNVTDALYDGFLPQAKNYLGWSKVGVIAHDFPESELQTEKLFSRMDSFRHSQSTTFKCASLVLIGGQLSNDSVELTDGQQEELQRFFGDALSPPLKETVVVNFHRFLHFIRPFVCCICEANDYRIAS